jgi:trans-2,3-dihydro-3-hydroxyanthranilate isomerase
MPTYPFVTVDVFTARRFGGNQLAVFTAAQGLSTAEMQSFAAEFGYSETTFVLPPEDPANTARVRIFTPQAELPFAGHPNVGTGYVLARQAGNRPATLRFEELAGLVEVRIQYDASGGVTGAEITAPQPLSLGPTLPPEAIAACASIAASDVITDAHQPVMASVGLGFFMAQVTPEALTRASPDFAGFRGAVADFPALEGRLALHLYARAGDRLDARMFAPLGGITEDPATGSANAALAALLLSVTEEAEARYEVTQGVEMGRPSLLRLTAHRAADGIRATVGGECVPVLTGEASLD